MGGQEYTAEMDSYFLSDRYNDDAAALALASLDHASPYTTYDACAGGVYPADEGMPTSAETQDPHHSNYVLPLAFTLDGSPTISTPSLRSRSSSTPHELSGYQTPTTPGGGALPTSTPLVSSIEDDNPNNAQQHFAHAADHYPAYDYDPIHSTTPATTTTSAQTAAPLLHVAARSRNRRIMTTLLKHGVPPNERDELGRTALHVAAALGDEALVALLLRCGADAAICDVHGQTALYAAVEGGFGEVVELLLEGGGGQGQGGQGQGGAGAGAGAGGEGGNGEGGGWEGFVAM